MLTQVVPAVHRRLAQHFEPELALSELIVMLLLYGGLETVTMTVPPERFVPSERV